ncbi:MAG TPA: hypothetical protein DCF63_06845 [Planctomycetaceae bacterium]|nr:hypothetical protein [Planctomycetaceae bacterium]
MIVIGTWDWPKTLRTGQFYCPACSCLRQFRHRSSRPFLTLYFVPVIPIGGRQEYVQCQSCKEKFELAVLGEAQKEPHSFESDLIKVAALTILEDRTVTEPEILRSLQTIVWLGGPQLSRDELGMACSEMRSGQLSLGGFLWTAKQRWSDQQRLQIMQAVFLIASAEGSISTSRMKGLLATGQLLELKQSEIEYCILQAEQLALSGK